MYAENWVLINGINNESRTIYIFVTRIAGSMFSFDNSFNDIAILNYLITSLL